MLKGYICTAEEMQMYCFQILDSVWPDIEEKARLIGVKLSNLKNQAEVKRDKQVTDFFKKGLSKEDYHK